MPSLEGVDHWINGEVNDADLQGRAVLVHFWAVSCPACLQSIGKLKIWRDQYAPQGLRIVAVHLPRMFSDRKIEVVQKTVSEVELDWPCAVDSEEILGKRFETGTIWPYYFLFDAQNKMRTRAAGGVGLRLLENSLQRSVFPKIESESSL